ncbi:MAG: hypothetical protein HY921_03745 [Elusimicrobia bacterium]|nr:hypothetical protein [Elusimicrobiota bacterium]
MKWLLMGLLASPWALSAQEGPRCSDGSKPRLTGHPFQPLSCAQEPSAESPLPDAEPPGDGKNKASLKDVAGRWEGLSYYGGGRYEILLEIKRSGGSYRVTLSSMDYHTHAKNVLHGKLTGSFWSDPGRYGASVELDSLPGARLDGKAWVSALSEPGYDREFSIVYRDRPGIHRIKFALEGKDKIRYAYTFLHPARGPAGAMGELSRSQR